MHYLLAFLTILITVSASSAANPANDVIADLPGLTFNINFKQYSGYLMATPGNYLHYWLVESQSANPASDPLILWLNGGPGCSSLGGLMTELGPFHTNVDGQTLFENVYSWNKGANVLFLEAPRDVGFSYRDPAVTTDPVYNDVKTVTDNVLALKDFFNSYPQYQNRSFYVAGESYGGVYVPTLTAELVRQKLAGTFLGLNLVGMAVGNGELSEYEQINSAISLLYAHGMYGKGEFDLLAMCCVNSTSLMYCDFSQYIYLDDQGNAIPKYNSTTGTTQQVICSKLVEQMGFDRVWNYRNDVYNLYQDCYDFVNGYAQPGGWNKRKPRFDPADAESRANGFVDQNTKINWQSTDNLGSFPCFMDQTTQSYLNMPAVRQALHIPPSVANWSDCNDFINSHYVQQNHDTTPVFQYMLNSGYPLRILIYNGDVDSVCNFLGDEWFVENVVQMNKMKVSVRRQPWYFQTNAKFDQQIAGYYKAFSSGAIATIKATIDLVTVKGAGHFVPTDRPGPALQMITNFIRQQNYSTLTGYDATPKPLKPQYLPPTPTQCPQPTTCPPSPTCPPIPPTSPPPPPVTCPPIPPPSTVPPAATATASPNSSSAMTPTSAPPTSPGGAGNGVRNAPIFVVFIALLFVLFGRR